MKVRVRRPSPTDGALRVTIGSVGQPFSSRPDPGLTVAAGAISRLSWPVHVVCFLEPEIQ